MKLYYRVGTGGWNNVNMTLSGGIYTGTIPGQSAAAIVQFYVEGTDGLGRSPTFRLPGRQSRHVRRAG